MHDIDALLEMASRHPGMQFSPAIARSLLTTMRRSEEHVLDLAGAGGTRQLVAVVLDTLDNSSEAAELVILGRDPAASPDLVARAISAAEDLTRRGPRRKLLLAFPTPLRDLAELARAHGFAPAFVLYDMEADLPVTPPPDARSGARWRPIDEDTVAAYAAVSRRAFAGLPGASFPEPDVIRRNALAAVPRPEILVEGDAPIAFVRVSVIRPGDTASVDVIGRDPTRRGERLGDVCMARALELVAATGAKKAVLSVAAVNARARGLYERWGFRVVGEEPTYIKELG
jgi:ribosomal protein S18 acetylase RimI-like enzyme